MLIGQCNCGEICGQSILAIKPTDFMTTVRQHGNFQDLGTYMIALNLLPLNNAAIERIFSICWDTKTKLRNILIISTLDSLVMVKMTLMWLKKCFFEFEVPNSCVEKFNNNIYLYFLCINFLYHTVNS